MRSTAIRIEVDGQPATAEQLQHPAVVNYGHYTAMQVRNGRARGLTLHLNRLDAATRELFDAGMDAGRVRDHVRHALAGLRDASVRVGVFRPDLRPDGRGATSVMVVVRPPVDPPHQPRGLKSVPYQRPLAHIKHAGAFGQLYYGRVAERHGFDDALLTAPDGTISEAGISNFAVSHGRAMTWPDAPCLAGVTMQLLEPGLPGAGVPTRRAALRLPDLTGVTGAFVTNSHGVAAVDRVDDTRIPVDRGLLKTLVELYESVPWDPI